MFWRESKLREELRRANELCEQLQAHNARLNATVREQADTISELLGELKDLKEQL